MKNLLNLRILIVLITFATAMAACVSPQKLTRSGRYDESITILCKKLARKKTNDKRVMILEEAFTKANEKDLNLIDLYKKEGRPDQWDEINAIYRRIDARQNKIEPLMPLYVVAQNRKANIDMLSINGDLVKSKEKAADFYYAHAVELIKKGDKMSAREAYSELGKLNTYYPNYKDANELKIKAHNQGMNYVLYSFKNSYRGAMPEAFEREFMKISLEDQNDLWLNYHVYRDRNITYDYEIQYKLKDIIISPEQNNERSYEDTKKVKDGWEYVLDAKGNVKKDSLGNDMKIEKFKIIKAQVLEVNQRKNAVIVGEINYFNNHNNQLIEVHEIGSEAKFEHYAATYRGDKNALSEASKTKIGNAPVPFPTNEALVMQANATIKPLIKQKISTLHNVVMR